MDVPNEWQLILKNGIQSFGKTTHDANVTWTNTAIKIGVTIILTDFMSKFKSLQSKVKSKNLKVKSKNKKINRQNKKKGYLDSENYFETHKGSTIEWKR